MRDDLELTNGALGLLLLAIAAGSVLALPTTGALINRFGTVAVLRFGLSSAALGLVTRPWVPQVASYLSPRSGSSPTASAPASGTSR